MSDYPPHQALKIALDYDQTFTADPGFWRTFVDMAFNAGHEVKIVTARNEEFDRTPDLIEIERTVDVIYCRGIAKKWFLTHFGDGFVPDIWIDDRPESIFQNSEMSPEKLAEWRTARVSESTASE
jgi:hypothetical protein